MRAAPILSWPSETPFSIPLQTTLPLQGTLIPVSQTCPLCCSLFSSFLWRGNLVTMRQLKDPGVHPDVLLADLQHCRYSVSAPLPSLLPCTILSLLSGLKRFINKRPGSVAIATVTESSLLHLARSLQLESPFPLVICAVSCKPPERRWRWEESWTGGVWLGANCVTAGLCDQGLSFSIW